MERYNIILRTLGATMLALALVLIPLSQAKAERDCADLSPGESTWYCERYTCDTSYIGPFYVVSWWKVTITRPTDSPSCTENWECPASGCIDRFRIY